MVHSAASNAGAPLSIWNVLNALAYVANTAIVFGVGVSGWFTGATNAELSAKYQTLITPVGWSFTIWIVIFVAQLVWAVLQLVQPRYRLRAIQQVQYNYILVCAAQIGWTIAFGFEILWLSMVMMSLILIFLIRIFVLTRRHNHHRLGHEKTWIEEYFLLEFPFTIHCGWITVATVLNANVLLVAYNVNPYVEFFAALLSVVIVLVASSVFLSLPDFTVPLVAIWALAGVYVELSDSSNPIRDRFSDNSVPVVRQSAGLAIIALIVSFLIRLYTACSEYRRHAAQGGSNSSSLSSHATLEEPFTKGSSQHQTSDGA